MNIISICLVTIFAVWGVGEFIRTIVLFFSKKTGLKNCFILIVPIKNRCEHAEYLLRNAAEEFRWRKHNKFTKICCVLDNTDEQTEKICRTISKEYSFMEVVYLKDFEKIF